MEQGQAPQTGKGPVGSGERVVRGGDCLLSIAYESGHFYEKLWLHPDNAAVRSARKAPTKLLPGDRIHVPEIEIGRVSAATEQRHKFLRKGVPAKLRLRVLQEEPPLEQAKKAARSNPNDLHAASEDPEPPPPPESKPRADVPYRLIIDGKALEGTTSSDGEVVASIPPNAREGELVLEPGTERETRIPLRLGGLDPPDEPTGVAQRLTNLGFPADAKNAASLAAGIAAFQEVNGIKPTGKADESTRAKIQELHGS